MATVPLAATEVDKAPATLEGAAAAVDLGAVAAATTARRLHTWTREVAAVGLSAMVVWGPAPGWLDLLRAGGEAVRCSVFRERFPFRTNLKAASTAVETAELSPPPTERDPANRERMRLAPAAAEGEEVGGSPEAATEVMAAMAAVAAVVRRAAAMAAMAGSAVAVARAGQAPSATPRAATAVLVAAEELALMDTSLATVILDKVAARMAVMQTIAMAAAVPALVARFSTIAAASASVIVRLPTTSSHEVSPAAARPTTGATVAAQSSTSTATSPLRTSPLRTI